MQRWHLSVPGGAATATGSNQSTLPYLSQTHYCWSQRGVVYNIALESACQWFRRCPDGEGKDLEKQSGHGRMSLPDH